RPSRLVVGTLETIAAARLGPWLAGFRASHPGIEIEVRIAGSGTLLEQLGQGEIAIAFCFDTGQADERFAMRRLGDEPLVLI
ncbi:LysR family transcriptional regulator substrate-binding protein, partial [Acinetobacter baumannii]